MSETEFDAASVANWASELTVGKSVELLQCPPYAVSLWQVVLKGEGGSRISRAALYPDGWGYKYREPILGPTLVCLVRESGSVAYKLCVPSEEMCLVASPTEDVAFGFTQRLRLAEKFGLTPDQANLVMRAAGSRLAVSAAKLAVLCKDACGGCDEAVSLLLQVQTLARAQQYARLQEAGLAWKIVSGGDFRLQILGALKVLRF